MGESCFSMAYNEPVSICCEDQLYSESWKNALSIRYKTKTCEEPFWRIVSGKDIKEGFKFCSHWQVTNACFLLDYFLLLALFLWLRISTILFYYRCLIGKKANFLFLFFFFVTQFALLVNRGLVCCSLVGYINLLFFLFKKGKKIVGANQIVVHFYLSSIRSGFMYQKW